MSCLVLDPSSIESLDFLNRIELCELVEGREGLMDEKEEDESVM